MQNIEFTEEELKIIKMCNTPEKVQDFLDSLKYNFEEDGVETFRSLRGVIKHKTAHCFEGAISAASIMSQHGFRPLIICMEASDIDHNIFVYWCDGRVGSIAKSRQVELHGRSPIYETYYDLVMSYYPDYYNWFTQDKKDITMRGWAIIDLNIFSNDWITSENTSFIEDYLYAIPYKRLFPQNEDSFYYFRRDGEMIPI